MAEENNVNEMRQIKRNKLDALIDQGNDPHVHEKYEDRTYSKEIIENYDQYEEKTVRLAGRIMSKRGHGKISFMDLQDATGRIQLFNKLDELGQEEFDQVQNLDIGDIVGVEGEIFTTNSGEISVRTKDLTLLTKSLQILPEKYHGLTDTDLRYRQRYVDLIMNPDVKETFITRSQIINKIREYLDNHGFLEVETPVLNTIAGGASARPFITHHNTLDLDMYLRIANELYLKRLIVGGFDKVYEMGRMFRNEGMDSTHNPEYTSIELYVAYEDYEYMMVLTEDLINFVVEEVTGSLVIDSNGTEIDFSKPWQRMTMVDSIKKYASVDFDQVHSDEEAIKLAEDHGIEVEDHFTKGHIIEEFFDKYVEDNLIQPTFITHHPKATSPLAKKDPDNPEYTHRFEAFCKGAEIGNAYSELNDARDQRERFQAQVEAGKKGDDEAQMMDHDFINALEVGLAPTGGLGIGVDRLVMLITGEESIRDVILFPTMKPIGHDIENKEDFEEEGDQDNKEPISEGKKIDLSKVKVEPLFQDMVFFDEFSQCDVRAVKVKDCQEVPKSRNLLQFTLDDGSGEDRTILSGIKDYYNPEDLIGKTLLAIVNMPAKNMMGIDSNGMILSAVYDYDGEEDLKLLMVSNDIPAGAKVY